MAVDNKLSILIANQLTQLSDINNKTYVNSLPNSSYA